MTDHSQRMRELKRALEPVRSIFQLSEKQRRHRIPKWVRRDAKLKAKEASRRIGTIMRQGAGLLMDGQLREFFHEFNNRLGQFGPESMPTSFNVLEAFLAYEDDPVYFGLRPEHDHLFSFSDFVDFVTSADAPREPFKAAYNYQEGHIYSFNLYDDPHDLTFSSTPGREFGVGGVSLIRHGSEISLLLVAGALADLAKESGTLPEFEAAVPYPGKENITPSPDRNRRAEQLGSYRDLWKTIVLVRFDLASETQQVRYLLRDCGDYYAVATDDVSIFPGLVNDSERQTLAEMAGELSQHDVLFEICKTALLLQEYFRFKLTLVREERVPSPSSQGDKQPQPRRVKKGSAYSSRVIFRTVSALRVVNPPARAIRRFSAPRFRVEVDGFWRRLRPGRTGHNARGDVVEGRTWVRDHLRWRDLPERPIEVLVKSRVSIARATVEAEKLAKELARGDSRSSVPDSSGPVESGVSRDEAYRQRMLLTKRIRWAVFQRDDFRCRACGADAASDVGVRLDVDHITPISRGGKTEESNLQTLCSNCNNGKGDLIG